MFSHALNVYRIPICCREADHMNDNDERPKSTTAQKTQKFEIGLCHVQKKKSEMPGNAPRMYQLRETWGPL